MSLITRITIYIEKRGGNCGHDGWRTIASVRHEHHEHEKTWGIVGCRSIIYIDEIIYLFTIHSINSLQYTYTLSP